MGKITLFAAKYSKHPDSLILWSNSVGFSAICLGPTFSDEQVWLFLPEIDLIDCQLKNLVACQFEFLDCAIICLVIQVIQKAHFSCITLISPLDRSCLAALR